MANTVRQMSDENDVVAEIGKLWGEAQEKFLAIGRYLVQAKLQFHRSFEAAILPQLPFGKGVALQLRAIAVAVDDGRFEETELPHSYATAYQLVSLPTEHLSLARKENLVRKDVLRREVEAFRLRLRSRAPGTTQDLASLLDEWRRLRTERARLDLALRDVERRLGDNVPKSRAT